MRNGNEEGIVMGDKTPQEIPGFWDYLDLNIESALLVATWLHFRYRCKDARWKQVASRILCRWIPVSRNKRSSVRFREGAAADKARFQPAVFLRFRRCLEEVIIRLLRNMCIHIFKSTKVIFLFFLILWTMGNFISIAITHIFTFKNGLLLCACFFSFQESVYYLLFFLHAGISSSFSWTFKNHVQKSTSRVLSPSLYQTVLEHLLFCNLHVVIAKQ